MSFELIWLPDVLMAAGLKVAVTPGWQDRGVASMGDVQGVLCHHTGTAAPGNMPTLEMLKTGRSDLSGPLAQLGLGRDGTFYVVAAGRANHAGAGSWQGVTAGNTHFIGIEGENSGSEAWPDIQMQACQHGVAAILRHCGLQAIACAGHKEYALPPGRKVDPAFDMASFRAAVQAIMAGTTAPPRLIPAREPDGTAQRPTLRRGSTGEAVTSLQQKLGLTADGQFGPATEAAVRAFQRSKNAVPDGIVGPRTWALLP